MTPDTDPMAEALASLEVKPQPRKTRSGAIKFEPASEWSLGRLPEVETRYRQTQGRDLPVKVRGQGAIHDRWGYDHRESADIGLSPTTPEGQALMSQLREQNIPFLAFDRAIPGVATGPHIHIGRASHRLNRAQGFTPPAETPASDPMVDALSSLGVPGPPATQPTSAAQPQPTKRQITGEDVAWHLGADKSEFRSWDPKARARALRAVREAVDEDERKRSAEQEIGPTNPQYQNEVRRRAGLRPLAQLAARSAVMPQGDLNAKRAVPKMEEILAEARQTSGGPRTFEEDRAQRRLLGQRDQEAKDEIRRRIQSQPGDTAAEYKNFLLMNRALDSDRMREAFLDQQVKQRIAASGGDAASTIEREDAEAARQQRVAQMGWPAYLGQVPKSAVTGFASGLGTSLKGVAALAKKIDFTGEYDGLETSDLATYQLGEAITRESRKLVASNPDLEREFFVGKAPSTIGQAAQFMLGGWATKSPKLAVAIMGSTMTAGDAYDEVRARGGSDDEAVNAALLAGGLLGPTELIGMRGAMKALEGTVRETTLRAALKTALREGRRDVIENALQEMGQEAAQGIITKHPRTAGEVLEAGALGAIGGLGTAPLTIAAGLSSSRGERVPLAEETQGVVTGAEREEVALPQESANVDPMAEALAGVTIQRAPEPYAGPAEFRGMSEGDLYDLASRRPPKGTSRQKRLELIRSQAAAVAEIDRRQNEERIAETLRPDSGLRAGESDVPSFQEHVENRPAGGLKFDTLEPGSPDFNQLAGEYVERYGTRPRTVGPRPANFTAEISASQNVLSEANAVSSSRSGQMRGVKDGEARAVRDNERVESQAQETPDSATGRKFSSTQVDLPPAEVKLQKQAAAAIPDNELAADGREDKPHVTVKYGLHTDDAGELAALLADEPPIKLKIGKVSIFPAKGSADYDVVKMDVDSPDLHRLNAKIAKALPVTDTHPDYKPHVTLAYVRPGEGDKYVGQANALTGREVTLDKILFSSRSGKEVEIPLKSSSGVTESRVVESTQKATTPRKELPQIEPRAIGREASAVTERGSEINARYAVVDLNSLIASHDSALRPNPDFPPELQPRERDRAANADQISRIASNLRPEFLGESPKASEGAPIVGPDGIVESGNGRVLALRQAYESKGKAATAYKRYLVANAERLGLDVDAVRGAKSPVLVRIRTTALDRLKFVREANEQSIASMSPVEQARSDASSLKGTLLDLFRPSESGEIATAGNMNFVRAFMKDLVGPNEVNRYVTASGQVSQEGIARIRHAIFARAYGDSAEGLIALEKLAESTDNNVRNLTNAMLRHAPGFASLKEAIEKGTRYPLDAAPDVAAAMSKMSALRDVGTPVSDYLKQGSLYGEELTPLQQRLLQVFDQNKRGANIINAILENYLKGAEAAGDPRQAGMFGSEIPSKADLLEAAILEVIHGQGTQAKLFKPPQHQGLSPKPAADSHLSEVNPRESTKSTERFVDAPATADEAQGRSLGRFDSAIDRLKAQEELARERLAQRSTEQQKLIEEKGSEAGATIIPQDLYDYVVIGATKLAQRSLNAAQFIDELVKEFGESIRKHARAIFKFSQKMVMDTQKEIRNERLSKEIADRLFTENVPKDMQREALRIAAQFRTSTDTQGRFLSSFKSRVGEMARSYGAAGGELSNRVHLGDIARGHEMEAGNKYLSKIQDVYGAIKNDFERQRISNAVINALEDRASADRHLDTPEKKAVFENTVEMLDMFRAKLKALGYETRDDYFTHIRDVDVLDQILSDAKDPKDTSLNELVAAKSRFLQPRIDAKMEIKKDLPRVLYAYLKSVSKEIAYSDAVEYYYDHFLDDIPIGLRKNSVDRAIALMQNSLKPEQGRGRFFRTVGQLRSQQYRNFLAYNLKASAQNFTQVDFARMRWTKEASKLTGKLWRDRKVITGPLADAVSIASTKETPLMRFLEQFKGAEPSGTQGKLAETFNKYDPFQRSEGRNWAMTELGSIINSVVKRAEYKELKASKGSLEAINELLKRQDVFDAAVREAATIAAETQVAGNPAMRAEFYDAPLHRIIGMFTAFKTRQLQVLGEALGKQTGVDGARAQAILRRGLSGDAQPVEVLREIESQRLAMETMMKRAAKFNEDIGIPQSELQTMLRHLRGQETELNGIIKRLEPLSGGRPRAAVLTAKYFAKVGAISVFFNLFWESVYSGLYGDDDKDGEERVSTALKRAFWDILPSPFYGADPSKFLVSSVAPNFERSAPFGHVTKRGVVRDVVSYGTSVIPFAGVIDRATNRRLSGALVDAVAPKAERSRKVER
jgi:2'-5' RNA ligase